MSCSVNAKSQFYAPEEMAEVIHELTIGQDTFVDKDERQYDVENAHQGDLVWTRLPIEDRVLASLPVLELLLARAFLSQCTFDIVLQPLLRLCVLRRHCRYRRLDDLRIQRAPQAEGFRRTLLLSLALLLVRLLLFLLSTLVVFVG